MKAPRAAHPSRGAVELAFCEEAPEEALAHLELLDRLGDCEPPVPLLVVGPVRADNGRSGGFSTSILDPALWQSAALVECSEEVGEAVDGLLPEESAGLHVLEDPGAVALLAPRECERRFVEIEESVRGVREVEAEHPARERGHGAAHGGTRGVQRPAAGAEPHPTARPSARHPSRAPRGLLATTPVPLVVELSSIASSAPSSSSATWMSRAGGGDAADGAGRPSTESQEGPCRCRSTPREALPLAGPSTATKVEVTGRVRRDASRRTWRRGSSSTSTTRSLGRCGTSACGFGVAPHRQPVRTHGEGVTTGTRGVGAAPRATAT